MPLVPEFQIGLWNGWWFSLIYLAVNFGLMALTYHLNIVGQPNNHSSVILSGTQ